MRVSARNQPTFCGPRRRAYRASAGLCAVLLLASSPALSDPPSAVTVPAETLDDTYPLDTVERQVPGRGSFRCPTVPLVRYPGSALRYHSAVRVNPYFRERLGRFEQVVADVAREIYGRAPRRIRHIGTYNCRRIGGWPTLISEHGLGNGIDIAGFQFARAARAESLPAGLPAVLRRPFHVSVLRHWRSTDPAGAVHARFLHTLARRLIARRDIFRVLLGPGYPGHDNHFHFDVAPWRLIDMDLGPDQGAASIAPAAVVPGLDAAAEGNKLGLQRR